MSSVICIQFELEALSLDHLSGRLECFCGNVLLYSKGYAFLYLSSSTSWPSFLTLSLHPELSPSLSLAPLHIVLSLFLSPSLPLSPLHPQTTSPSFSFSSYSHSLHLSWLQKELWKKIHRFCIFVCPVSKTARRYEPFKHLYRHSITRVSSVYQVNICSSNHMRHRAKFINYKAAYNMYKTQSFF